ncbi:hypothetical protein [Ruminiclostridium papyrosolvens]|uniref:Uncharacterized protein n=1 Tax=Ruminiclostridium papyrosolvens C7 TaxID=1330534 RepID=U4QZR6_9FIRM|nr:hypothetical protein [Ruminiclostridium papyrosolvens]EPR10474.1 hypothetical protein L323_12570 [Ruminiclostridium papyrosolvens C7]
MEVSESQKKSYNFLINASNQANLVGTDNVSPVQINSLFIFVSPYVLEKVNMDDLDIDISIDKNGKIHIDGHCFDTIEVKSGINVLGILKR